MTDVIRRTRAMLHELQTYRRKRIPLTDGQKRLLELLEAGLTIDEANDTTKDRSQEATA
ncbi:hypothetical protein HYZ99_02795 [Candidatus Peregrinibacteria bacterium]|nr:hypothetical protein [Candidatus Peregrinibacteria bacterium]